MAGLFADVIELPLEGIAGETLRRGNDELLNVRLTGFCRGADVSFICLCWDLPPPDELLALGGDEPFHNFFTMGSLACIFGEKNDAGSELTRLGQLGAELLFYHAA